MRIVCISDTHLRHSISIPDGDVLLHAGDGTMDGSEHSVTRWVQWLASLPHGHKLLIAGNHDWLFQRRPALARGLIPEGVTYLEDSGVVIDGLRIWGSPWQPWFMDWAFNLPRGPELAAKWKLIPDGTEVLLTHTPPYGILDNLPETYGKAGSQVGCEDLMHRINALPRLKLHVFGHIHHAYGRYTDWRGRLFVNASVLNEDYRPANPPVVVDI